VKSQAVKPLYRLNRAGNVIDKIAQNLQHLLPGKPDLFSRGEKVTRIERLDLRFTSFTGLQTH
jgi:hypothetical protein